MSNMDQSSSSIQPPQVAVKKQRDPRLDFWRGIAMLIILVAHIPGNFWAWYIPARWGPSDAAEMFVFCSGFAAAIAFGGTFERAGFWMGTRRILFRCWQIYWAHMGLFFFIAMTTVITTWIAAPDGVNYMKKLNLIPFFETNTAANLVGLFTLTYVPNYFDILPMYMIILLMVPLVIMLQRLHTGAAIAFCVGLYLATWYFKLGFPAEPWSERKWFFNPLGWQLLFFTGFMLSKGWIKGPPVRTSFAILAIIFILAVVPISNWMIYKDHSILQPIHDFFWVKGFKTNEHLLRWAHVLALTYVAVWAIRGHEQALLKWPCTIIVKVGQQALAAFLASMAIAWNLGFVLDEIGRTNLNVALVNIFGLACVIATAYIVSWYKSEPWKRRAKPERANVASEPKAASGALPATAPAE